VTKTVLLLCVLGAGAVCAEPQAPAPAPPTPAPAAAPAKATDARAAERKKLVEQVRRNGVHDEGVLAALGRVPRHELVPADVRPLAYLDRPLAIGMDQTISQPTVVGMMSELLAVKPGAKVLEVGTGSGYQAAVLTELGADVYTIEIVDELGRRAARDLKRLGYDVHTRIGDGYRGWPDAAPFDGVIVTAAPPRVPQPLVDQLKVGGRLVLPVGPEHGEQVLRVITKTKDGTTFRDVAPVAFVPMTGEAQERR
jgi:protein-L-isoaspartate(D-aspartate) O-methyltransferase